MVWLNVTTAQQQGLQTILQLLQPGILRLYTCTFVEQAEVLFRRISGSRPLQAIQPRLQVIFV